MEAENAPETSIAVNQFTSHRIREESNLQQQPCDNLKFRTFTTLETCCQMFHVN
jgi:hypothetical protein